MTAWKTIAEEAARCFTQDDPVAARAYSEFMPPPYVALKPYALDDLGLPAVGGSGFGVTEYEEADELAPGFARIARHLLLEIEKLVRPHPDPAQRKEHEFSATLLKGNPAWPAEAACAKRAPRPLTLALSLALSRTQDDKGRVRWTLFGTSHAGPARAFWESFGPRDEARFVAAAAWLAGVQADTLQALEAAGLRVLPRTADPALPAFDEGALPAFAKPLLWKAGSPAPKTLLTFEPLEKLPPPLKQAWLADAMTLVPTPAGLAFFEHPGYHSLAKALPWAQQIPLLQMFPRSESSYALRIPQSGWLDEKKAGEARADGHKMARTFVRTHRWERVARDADLAADAYADLVTVALFSDDPKDLGLYRKPMARNSQIWTPGYDAVLHGPRADAKALAKAAAAVRAGGRFGYRFFFPPMRAGARSLFWHRPLLARMDPATGAVTLPPEPLLGFVTAERDAEKPLELRPTLLRRDGHREAADSFVQDKGLLRRTTTSNLRKIFEFSEMLGGKLTPALAHRLLDVAKDSALEPWLESLKARAADPAQGEKALEVVRRKLSAPAAAAAAGDGAPASLTYAKTHTRAFEEELWTTIAALAEGGEFRHKDNADVVTYNEGKTGGELGLKLGLAPARSRDLDKLADHLHVLHQRKIDAHGMTGRAFVADHRFRWETDFDMGWSKGWSKNRSKPSERNVVVVIPGKDPKQVVVMADHYDTAYMEDVFYPSRGGDELRAAAHGADDNHSATTALLLAADALLPMAREGKLEKTVWLVHLTGEEFPADCLGARALARSLVRGDLALTQADGQPVDVAGAKVVGAYVLDMIGHNNDNDRDVFQIAPGEGAGSARLAQLAHVANERWNKSVPAWNKDAERKGKGRSKRIEDPKQVPQAAEHLALRGEIRTEWEPRSALYNTDGQIFSDLGIPVVLFMENYDIRRTGYHDTNDTMKNIDLDYCAALAAITIESVADLATRPPANLPPTPSSGAGGGAPLRPTPPLRS
ncbi:MAG TPA: M28 family peptidase [Myxococcales bacterium]|jgi:hypothetical protein